MCWIEYTCKSCGKERQRPDWVTPCYENLCCDCCRKKGLQDEKCKLNTLELELIRKGKKLNRNEEKGVFLEKAMSTTLENLGVPHKHNPFKLYYPNYQARNPDIIIEALSAIVECKNLNRNEVKSLSTQWLDKNVIDRPNTSGYTLKMVLFSFKPRSKLIQYLKSKGWRTYGIGFQILNQKQEKKAARKLKQHFWWLKKRYDQNQQ